MGYTTDFDGDFTVAPQLRPEHRIYLEAFAGIRHVQRDAAETAKLSDPVREAAGLPVGEAGAYYVGDDGRAVLDPNHPPAGQPGLRCQWRPLDEGAAFGWDGGEKFYDYVAWLDYLIERFLEQWGYRLDGTVTWQGEDQDDRGVITIEANQRRVTRRTEPWTEADASRSRYWPQEVQARLIIRSKEGADWPTLATELDRWPSLVRARLRRLGLPDDPNETDADRERQAAEMKAWKRQALSQLPAGELDALRSIAASAADPMEARRQGLEQARAARMERLRTMRTAADDDPADGE